MKKELKMYCAGCGSCTKPLVMEPCRRGEKLIGWIFLCHNCFDKQIKKEEVMKEFEK